MKKTVAQQTVTKTLTVQLDKEEIRAALIKAAGIRNPVTAASAELTWNDEGCEITYTLVKATNPAPAEAQE